MSQTGIEGSGKNKKSRFFLLGLMYILRTSFKSKISKILPWAEQSGTQIFSLSNLLVVSSSCAALFFQHFDIWWSTLGIIDNFKAISRTVFFHFGEIDKSWFWVLSKNYFFQFFLVFFIRFLNIKKVYQFFFSFFQNFFSKFFFQKFCLQQWKKKLIYIFFFN